METILEHAQGLVHVLLHLMPSSYQHASLSSLLGLFLEAQGHPLPQQCQTKSASALSRFLNQYEWSTRDDQALSPKKAERKNSANTTANTSVSLLITAQSP